MKIALIALVFCLGMTSAWTADTWSGRIVVEEVDVIPEANPSERAHLEKLAVAFEEKINDVRTRLEDADTTDALELKILQQDLVRYEEELETVRLQRGGDVIRSQMTYELFKVPVDGSVNKAARLIVTMADSRLFANPKKATAEVVAGSQRQGVELQIVRRRSLEQEDQATVVQSLFDKETKQTTIRVGDKSCVVKVLSGMPNPFALTLLTDGDSENLHAALAQVAGMPAWIRLGDQRVWRIRSLEEKEFSESHFVPPKETP